MKKEGVANPMKGDPKSDIPRLCQLLLNGDLSSKVKNF